jgi:four helix bundle protein
MGDFRKLNVWQDAKDLAVDIYKITNNINFKKDYPLIEQIRRSAISISSNIAEGDERSSNKESIRFFYIANGSLAELITQLTIAYEIGYFEKDVYDSLVLRLEKLSKQIKTLINHRSNNESQKI